jgi:LPS export ABC transporter protein LptC
MGHYSNEHKIFSIKKIFLLTLGILFFFTGCEKSLKQSDVIIIQDSLPQITIHHIEASYSDSGFVQMKLISPLLEKYKSKKEPYTEFTKGIFVYFYDEFHNKISSLKADYAIYKSKQDIWEYKGNVELINEDGEILKTEHLFAEKEKEKIYSEKLVTINYPDGNQLEGAGGFISNFTFTEYEFRDVSGELNY